MQKSLIRTFGIVLLLLGFVGFFSNSLVGAHGYFYANAGMSIISILASIFLLGVSGNETRSALTLRTVGIIYFAIAIIGFALVAGTGTASVLGFMAVNLAASWLYAVLGVVMFASSFARSREALMFHHERSHA